MRTFFFDAFIDAIIASEPVISEPNSILQRIDFQNGYGEHSLLTHLRILMKTLVDYTEKPIISLQYLIEIGKSYDNIRRNDIELAYRIIDHELKPLTFRILKKYFILISVDSMKRIMKCIQKQKYNVNKELSVNDLDTNISSTTSHMKYAIDDLFPQLVMEIPENDRISINTPKPSPVIYSSHNKSLSKIENKDFSVIYWIYWIFCCRKSK